MTATPLKGAFNIKHAAEYVDVSERKMRELIAAGHIAAITPPGAGHKKILRAELDAWLDAGE